MGVLNARDVMAEVTGNKNPSKFQVGDRVSGRGELTGAVVGHKDGDPTVRWEDGEEWTYPDAFLTPCQLDSDTEHPVPDKDYILPPVLNPELATGLKYDCGKDPWHLLPIEEVEDIVKVLAYGAEKYGPNNWQNVEPAERYYAAAIRHLVAWRKGELVDPESGLAHLAHAACSLLFLGWKDRNQ